MIQRAARAFELRFKERSKWHPIPAWAKYLISIGSSLTTARSPECRIVATISVPTSSFAAAFISLGRILNEPIAEPAASAVDSHFEMLSALPNHTPLIYFNGEALFNGPFLGTLQQGGQSFIRMAIKSGTCMIPKNRCLLVEIQPESSNGRPNGQGARLRNPKPFVAPFFTLAEHYRILCSTKRSVIIVGEQNRLREELVQVPFAIPIGTGHAEGVLQDLIRVGKFSSGGIGCRAGVYARSREHVVKNDAAPSDRELIVLDGAVSHFRWVHQYSNRDTISILSKTEPEYGNAMDSANNRYLNRLDDLSLPGLCAPPAGVDLMLHTEARE
jgi:hypothetical protein